MPNHKLLIAAILFPLNMFIMVFYALLLSEKHFCNKKIHRLLLNSYLISGGWSNSLIAYLISKRSEILTKFNNPRANSCLFEPKTHPGFEKKFKELNEDGYVIFEDFLSEDDCDELLKYALTANGSRKDDKHTTSSAQIPEKFHRDQPQSTSFNYDSTAVLNSDIACKIMLDPLILTFAKQYLKATPIIDIVTMWWSAESQKPDRESAQFYHFDMDRTVWLKAFVYLTDVKKTSGPHKFIKGSHKNGGIPWKIRKLGYERISDQLALQSSINASEICMVGKKGTLILEDTRGLHKGQQVVEGDRLVIQFQYTNSNFGAPRPNFKKTGVLSKTQNYMPADTCGILRNFS